LPWEIAIIDYPLVKKRPVGGALCRLTEHHREIPMPHPGIEPGPVA